MNKPVLLSLLLLLLLLLLGCDRQNSYDREYYRTNARMGHLEQSFETVLHRLDKIEQGISFYRLVGKQSELGSMRDSGRLLGFENGVETYIE